MITNVIKTLNITENYKINIHEQLQLLLRINNKNSVEVIESKVEKELYQLDTWEHECKEWKDQKEIEMRENFESMQGDYVLFKYDQSFHSIEDNIFEKNEYSW